MSYPLIGVVGGMGPYAGLDLMKKILANTIASKDQDHIPVLLSSLAHKIANRPDFLLNIHQTNPGYNMAELMLWLEKAGATHVAVPCNTAHAEPIWSVVLEKLKEANSKLVLVHILEELKKEISSTLVKADGTPLKMGVLATIGTVKTGLYDTFFNSAEFELVYPHEEAQNACMDAIFSEEYGLKAFSENVTEQALAKLDIVLEDLKAQGVDLFILGCTELSFGLPEKSYLGIPCVDPLHIQARALIRATYPDKLKA